MRLSVKGFAIAGAITFGLGVFVGGVIALLEPDWGTRYIELLGAIYPGVEGVNFGAVVIATLYAVVDGGIACAVFAWLYNRLAAGRT